MTHLMRTRPMYYRPQASRPSIMLQVLAAAFGGLVLFLLMLLALPAAYGLAHTERIFPGISVAGVDLSGLEPSQAVELLQQKLDYPDQGRIVFQEGQNRWVATPRQLGFYLDPQVSVDMAYSLGHRGDVFSRLSYQLQAWQTGIDLPPVAVFDERVAQAFLQTIATQVDRPIIEASLSVHGVDVVVNAGQVGRILDVPAAMDALRAQLPSLQDGIIPLTVRETPPVILDPSQQAEIARAILSAPLTISVPDPAPGDPGPWTFEPQTLAAMLTIERVQMSEGGARYQVGLDPQTLRSFLNGIAPNFVRTPQNARFVFDDETHQLKLIQPAVIGRTLDIETSLQIIQDKLAAGEHQIALAMELTHPAVTDDATAESLGITELVSTQTSYFYGSSGARIQNIVTAASRFHGVLVPPGATFSMAEVLGDVSLDNGYAEALIIFGDQTIKGVGGGVCQVSTTLFRTAFFGGYPIVERYAHAYRVGYYEQTASGGYDSNLAGLDATVFAPVVDFKFTNDRSAWLLMETYVNEAARTLTWKFYSAPDGRTVQWNTTGPRNIVQPDPPIYEENPNLKEGEIKQVDWEAEGADITVYRTVSRDGAVLFEDVIATHYLPWRARYQYGPGTEGIPTPEPTASP